MLPGTILYGFFTYIVFKNEKHWKDPTGDATHLWIMITIAISIIAATIGIGILLT